MKCADSTASVALGKESLKHFDFLLAAVIIARSSAYLFSKICLASMGTFNLLAIRFMLGFVLLAVLFNRRLRHISLHTAIRGVILGAIFFAVMSFELLGLRTTNSSTVSFLENTAIAFVPLFEAVLHRKAPKLNILLCGALTLVGIGLLTIKGRGLALAPGELLCLMAAVMYATAIITTDRFSHSDDPLVLGIIQVGTIGVLGTLATILFESPRLPDTRLEWGCILYLALICTGFGFTLQPLAQSHTSSEKAGMFCAINPLSASVLGMIFLNESFSLTNLTGAAFIICSIVLYGKSQASVAKSK